MNRIKLIGLTLVAVFAFSAAASAVEGPFYKVEGKRLAAGESRLLLASAKTKFVLTALTQTITCEKLTLPVANEMQIIGSNGANAGKSLEVLDYSECSVTGNGTPCEPTNGLIVTNLIVNLLGYSSSTKSGLVLVLFEGSNGGDFATVTFTGSGCTVPSALVKGTVIGLARANGAPVEVGAEPAEALHGEVSFAGKNKTIWIENEGVLTSVKSRLEAFGNESKLEGTALLLVDLASGPVNWGVFTA